MSEPRRPSCVESLERRTYAAKVRGVSSDFYLTSLGIDPNRPDLDHVDAVSAAIERRGPAAVVRPLQQGEDDTRENITVRLAADKTLYLGGTFGDDVFNLRTVRTDRGPVLTIEVVSLQNRTNLASDRPASELAVFPVPGEPGLTQSTLLSANTYEVDLADVRRIAIDGRDGRDSVRVRGLPLNPAAYDVEDASIKQAKAPAGRTPSDTQRDGRFGPKSGWAKEAAALKNVAADANVRVRFMRQAGPRTAFFGDSHAALLPTVGRATVRSQFPGSVSLGIGGDTTRQLLTRIEDGLFDRYKPATLIVSVGANNLNDPTTGGTDAQVARGILDVMHALRRKLPNAELLLIGLVPRQGAGLNERVKAINAAVASSTAGDGFTFLDVYGRFAADPKNLLTASSHFTAKGYRVLGSLIAETLRDK